MQFEGEFDISSNHVATKYNLTKSFQKLTAFHNEKWLTNYDCNREKKTGFAIIHSANSIIGPLSNDQNFREV